MITLINILAGVALLVWGAHIVRSAVLRVFGAGLRHVLQRSVESRLKAFSAGLGITMVVQSSSATCLIVGSFVERNLIGLAPALTVMLGADVGTSLVVQVFALDLSLLSPILLFSGVVMHLSRKGTRTGHVGRVLVGVGLILLALQMTMQAAQPLTKAHGVQVVLGSLTAEPVLDVLVGAAITVVVWSSLAVVLLTATFVAAGVVGADVGLNVVLGANLGSGLLAVLATLGMGRASLRVASGNLLFRIVGCAIAVPLLRYLELPSGLNSEESGRLVVNFHLLFNVLLAACMIGLTRRVADVIKRLLPDQIASDGRIHARFLDRAALSTPALATSNATREALRMGELVETMLRGVSSAIKANDAEFARRLRRMDDDVDTLYGEIKLYLIQISRAPIDEREARRCSELMAFTINMEQIGDIVERIVDDLLEKKITNQLSFPNAGLAEISDLHARLMKNLALGLNVFLSGDLDSARALLEQKAVFRSYEKQYAAKHLERLAGQSTQTVETSAMHLDIINDFRRINSHICSLAYPVLEHAGVLTPTRFRPVVG